MRLAFCNRALGLSYTDPTQFEHFVFKDIDLSGAGMRKLIPWIGEWHMAHICEDCGVYTIEYKKAFSRKEVETIIADMQKEHATAQHWSLTSSPKCNTSDKPIRGMNS